MFSWLKNLQGKVTLKEVLLAKTMAFPGKYLFLPHVLKVSPFCHFIFPMNSSLHTTATLISRKVKFECTSRDNPAVIVDYTAPIGEGEGYTSLEIFLVSLSTCVASSVALLLRKKGFTVTGLTVTANGERREEHPTCFKTIALDFRLSSPDLTEQAVTEALAVSEKNFCPVWAMVKGNVEINTSFNITRA